METRTPEACPDLLPRPSAASQQLKGSTAPVFAAASCIWSLCGQSILICRRDRALGWNGTPWWMIFALLDEEERNRDAPEPKLDVEALHTRWRKIKSTQYQRFKKQNKQLLEKIEELNRHD